jgi:hypothetical protein
LDAWEQKRKEDERQALLDDLRQQQNLVVANLMYTLT